MKDLLTNFPFDQLGVWATIIVIFTYNVLLGRDMACTCKPQEQQRVCNLYMGLPFFTVLLLMLWMDKKFQRVCKRLCCSLCRSTESTTNPGKNQENAPNPPENPGKIQENAPNPPENPGKNQENAPNPPENPGKIQENVCCRLLCVLVSRFFKAAFISGLWVVTVLIDGDWYVCCKNDHSEQQAQLSCKDKNNITTEEKATIAELKNKSKIIGFGVLLGIVLGAALMSCCPWTKWCSGRKCLYDKLILEEEKIVLTEILRTAAKEKLNEAFIVKIGDKNWEDCYKVADELMKCDKPALSETQKQEFDKLMQRRQQQQENRQQQENLSLEQDDQQPQTSSGKTPRSKISAGESLELKPKEKAAAAPQRTEDAV